MHVHFTLFVHFSLTIQRGWKSEAGELQVEYSGCTPAYAGVEVHHVKNIVNKANPIEKDKIKKANPIDASSHDLLASCLTILSGVFGKSQTGNETLLFWQRGSEGFTVLNLYWG